MLGDVIQRTKRKARNFLLDDQSTVVAKDRLPFEQYEEYPEGKHAIIRLPRPFKAHQKSLIEEHENKRLKDSEKHVADYEECDKRLVAGPDAILGVHLLELENISLRSSNFIKSAPIYYYALISVGDIRKMTKPCLSEKSERVRMDSLLFFPIEVANARENFRNTIKFEIWTFQDPNVHIVLGSKDIHLYTLIQTVHSIERHSIWTDGIRVVIFSFEFAFAYGSMGYGHSNQLRNTKSNVFESIASSMFPRIRLDDEDLVDNQFNARVPRKLYLMGMNNFLLYSPENTIKKRKNAEDDDSIEAKFFRLHQVQFDRGQPIFAKTNIRIAQEEFEADFNDIYGEFICLSSRRERLDFLHDLVHGRTDDIFEIEAGPLFLGLGYETAEHIVRSDVTSEGLVYPKHTSCHSNTSAVVDPSDEQFLNSFPVLSRNSGWLTRLFGYEPIETDPHFGEEPYPLSYIRGYDKHYETRAQTFSHGLRYYWAKLTGSIWGLLKFLIPDLRITSDLPEIAVTLASPEGSVTDLHASWIIDEKEQMDYASATRRFRDPVHEAYEAVNRLLYEGYEKDKDAAASENAKNPSGSGDARIQVMDQKSNISVKSSVKNIRDPKSNNRV